uniref:Uncharacterized protein n=1 Tax=Arundo donax TaxID=35708 RepID=A0A0A9BT71_ARUDO
MPEKGSMSA